MIRTGPRVCAFHAPMRSTRQGFTLVEVLIVISILAILASLTLTVVSKARKAADESAARTMVQTMADQLENYKLDEGRYPAAYSKDKDPERNDFPRLFNALLDKRKADGGLGGRSAPYFNVEEKTISVFEMGEYVQASRDQRWSNKVDKYILDPYGQPYVYRCNQGHRQRDWMKNPMTFDLYSIGPNGKDDTANGIEGDENDDIGNW